MYRVTEGVRTVDHYIERMQEEPPWDYEARDSIEGELMSWFLRGVAEGRIADPAVVAQYIRDQKEALLD